MTQFYHFTNMVFELAQQYSAKKSKPYFGDYEKLYEKYKPHNCPSRNKSFFLVKSKDISFAEQFGSYKYLVEAESANSCYLFWNSALQNYCNKEDLVVGFKKDYGYLIGKPNAQQSNVIKIIVENYFNGVKPKKNDYETYDIMKDAESNVVEYLTNNIKVIKKF